MENNRNLSCVKPLLSIVVPVYNAHRYLSCTIESVLNQTISDWELLLVDDCSTDDSVNIIRKYKEKDSRIRLIERKVNAGGARIPRFDGILQAEGEYVSHIDADDFIEPAYFEKMLNRLGQTGADLVLSRIIYCNSEGDIDDGRCIPSRNFDMELVESGRYMCRFTINGWKISFAGVITKTRYYQDFVRSVYEVKPFAGFADEVDYRYLLCATSVVALCDAHYYYRQHGSSVVHHISKMMDRIVATNDLIDLVKKEFSDDADVLRSLHSDCIETTYRLMCRYYSEADNILPDMKKRLYTELRKIYSRIRKEKMKGESFKHKMLSSSFVVFCLVARVQTIYAKLKS